MQITDGKNRLRALKAWETIRNNKKRLSDRAHKAWATRKRLQAERALVLRNRALKAWETRRAAVSA